MERFIGDGDVEVGIREGVVDRVVDELGGFFFGE